MKKNKWLNGVLPLFLINFSIGAVYCWTLVKEAVNAYTGFNTMITDWCFSIAIFFLGMSAAFGGKIVEKNPKKSAFLTFIFFTLGWLLTGVGIYIKSAALTVVAFGVIQGIGLGLGYITPVKTMMIWFEGKKGFAAGLAIASFGIAGIIGNPLIGGLLKIESIQIYHVFFILTAIYGVATFLGSRLLYRPEVIEEEGTVHLNTKEVIFHGKFILLWLIIFLNISCGLALIGREKQVYLQVGVLSDSFITAVFCMITAAANVIGRIAFASWQDKLKQKHTPYYIMGICSLAICFILVIVNKSLNITDILPQGTTIPFLTFMTVTLIFFIQFFFGVGFGCLPNVLHQNYGIHQLSTVHGLILSAWGCAGLVGNQLSRIINERYNLPTLYLFLGVMYSVMFVILIIWTRIVKKEKKFA